MIYYIQTTVFSLSIDTFCVIILHIEKTFNRLTVSTPTYQFASETASEVHFCTVFTAAFTQEGLLIPSSDFKHHFPFHVISYIVTVKMQTVYKHQSLAMC